MAKYLDTENTPTLFSSFARRGFLCCAYFQVNMKANTSNLVLLPDSEKSAMAALKKNLRLRLLPPPLGSIKKDGTKHCF